MGIVDTIKGRLSREEEKGYRFSVIDANMHADVEKKPEKGEVEIEIGAEIEAELGIKSVYYSSSVESLIREMNKNSIKKAVLLPTEPAMPKKSPKSTNFALHSVSKNYPVFIPFGTVHPDSSSARYDLEEAIGEMELKGLLLAPDTQGFDIEDEGVWLLMEKVEELKIPVMLYTTYSPEIPAYFKAEALREMIASFKINFILPHMASGGDISGVSALVDLKNAYFETSHLAPDTILHAVDVMGEDRLIYGSDSYGGVYPRSELENILVLEIKKSAKEKILYNNISKVLKIKQ